MLFEQSFRPLLNIFLFLRIKLLILPLRDSGWLEGVLLFKLLIVFILLSHLASLLFFKVFMQSIEGFFYIFLRVDTCGALTDAANGI